MEKTSIPYLRLLNKVHHLTSEELINDVDWNTISQSTLLIYELLKKGTFYHLDVLPTHYFQDSQICLLLMNYQEPPISFVSPYLLQNPLFVCSVLDNNFSHIQYISPDYLSDDLLLWFVENFGDKPNILSFLKHCSINESLAKILVSKNGLNFKDLPDSFKNNLEVYRSASQQYYVQNFIHAGHHIKSNPYIVTQILEEQPKLYSFIDPSLKTTDFFLRKLTNIPDLLQYATNEIKNNENCVWESVKNSPIMLQAASPRLLDTASFCLQVYQDLSPEDINKSIKSLSKKVLADKDTMLALLPKLCVTSALNEISPQLKADKDIMFRAVQLDMSWFSIITEPLASDYSFFIECYQYYLKHDLFNSKNLFKHIKEDAFNDPFYLYHLYKNFSDTFLTSIYPIISFYNTDVIKELKEAHELGEESVINFMNKIKLNFELEQNLEQKNSSTTSKI